jgi:hypothetical protein
MRRFALCACPADRDPISGVITDFVLSRFEYTGSQSGHDLLFFDRNGRLTRVQTHATEELVLCEELLVPDVAVTPSPLALVRLVSGLTQAELARRSGVQRGHHSPDRERGGCRRAQRSPADQRTSVPAPQIAGTDGGASSTNPGPSTNGVTRPTHE